MGEHVGHVHKRPRAVVPGAAPAACAGARRRHGTAVCGFRSSPASRGRFRAAQWAWEWLPESSILPTVARLAGAPMPPNPLDGVDVWPILSGAQQTVSRDAFLYFDGWNLQCARMGQWKLHVARNNTPAWAPAPVGGVKNLSLASPELYNLIVDPGRKPPISRLTVRRSCRKSNSGLTSFCPLSRWTCKTPRRSTMQIPVGYTPTGALPIEQDS